MIQMTERARAKLLDLKARQEAGVHMMCPRCGMDTMKEPIHTNALSRSADVYVCDACGTTEAVLAHMKQDTPLFLWAAFCPRDRLPISKRALSPKCCRKSPAHSLKS